MRSEKVKKIFAKNLKATNELSLDKNKQKELWDLSLKITRLSSDLV